MHIHRLHLLILVLFLIPTTLLANTERIGDALFVLIPVSAVGMSYYNDDQEGTQQFLRGFSSNLVTTLVLKMAINKTRPSDECCDSFPSGHASVTFQGASFIQKRYGWKYGLLAYLGATYTGYSRIVSDKHYLDDVLVGAAIGMISSHYFTERRDKFHLSAFVTEGQYGMNIHYSPF